MPTVPGGSGDRVRSVGFGAPSFSGLNVRSPDVTIPEVQPQTGFGDIAPIFKQVTDVVRGRADDSAFLEASNNLDQWEFNNMFGEEGALSTRGKNAFDIANTTMTDFDKFSGEIRTGLSGNAQIAAFDNLTKQRRRSMALQLEKHASGEMARFKDAQFNAKIVSANTRAALYFNDPLEIAKSVNELEATIRADGVRRGAPQEAVNVAVDDQVSKLYTGAITSGIASNDPNDTLKAKALFDDLKEHEDLSPKDIVVIEQKFDAVLPQATARVEFTALNGQETRSDLEGISKELDVEEQGSGDIFLQLVEDRDKADFYNQLDEPDGAAKALHDLDSGKYAGLDDATRASMRKVAQDRFKTQQADAVIGRQAQRSVTESDLHNQSNEGTLTYAQIQAYRAENPDEPEAQDYADNLETNLSTGQKALQVDAKAETQRKKQVAGTDTYNGLWERYRNFEIVVRQKAKTGALTTKGAGDASITELLTFQKDVVKAQTDGHISAAQSAKFQQMIPILRKKIDVAVSGKWWQGDVLKDDIYSDAYDQGVNFFDNNPNMDSAENRKELFSDIFSIADFADQDKEGESDEDKQERLKAVGQKVMFRFVRARFPEFENVPDDQMPTVFFKTDGTTLNIPAGNQKAKSDGTVKPPIPLKDQYTGKGGRIFTLDEIKDTAKQRNLTTEETVRQLQARGIIE